MGVAVFRFLLICVTLTACFEPKVSRPSAIDDTYPLTKAILGAWKVDLRGAESQKVAWTRAALDHTPPPEGRESDTRALAFYQWLSALPADNPARSEFSAWLHTLESTRIVVRETTLTTLHDADAQVAQWATTSEISVSEAVLSVTSDQGDARTWIARMSDPDHLYLQPDGREELALDWVRTDTLPPTAKTP